MAVRFDTSGEEYTRSLGLGSVTNWTVTCWAKLMVDRATTSVVWMIDDGSGGNYLRITAWNGSALAYQTAGSAWFGVAGQTLAVGEWTYIGLSSTANPGLAQVRIRTAGSSTFVGSTPAQSNVTINAGTLRIAAGQAAGEWLNGSIAGIKVWDQALTVDELEQESWTYLPLRTSGLRAWYPLLRPETTDYSGAGQTLSGGTGAALDDPPPISWSAGRRRIVIPATPPPAGPTFRSASQVASGTGASFNCAKPMGAVSGDILVAFHAADTGTLADLGTPTGGSTWSLLASRARDDGTGSGTKVWWKVAGASEPANYGFTQNSGADGSVSIIAVQDGSTNTPVVAQTGGTGSGTAKTTPSTTAAAGDFEIRCVAVHAPSTALTFTSPAGFTERTDIQSGTYALTTTATRTLAAGGATGTADFTASASIGEWHGFTVNIASTVTTKSPADSATATETVDVSVDAPVADSATAAETLTVAASVDLADSATAVDDMVVTVTVGLSDSATADDSGVVVGAPVDLADSATAEDAWTVIPTPVLDEQATAGESLTVAATASFTDTATAIEDLAVIQIHNKDLADSATATESLTVIAYEDITVTAGAPRRGWSSQPSDRGWSADDARRGWSTRPPTT